jgi:hypothetical protein
VPPSPAVPGRGFGQRAVSPPLHVGGSHPHVRQIIEPHVDVAASPLARRADVLALAPVRTSERAL